MVLQIKRWPIYWNPPPYSLEDPPLKSPPHSLLYQSSGKHYDVEMAGDPVDNIEMENIEVDNDRTHNRQVNNDQTENDEIENSSTQSANRRTRSKPPRLAFVDKLRPIYPYFAFFALGLQFAAAMLYWLPILIWRSRGEESAHDSDTSGLSLFVTEIGEGILIITPILIIFSTIRELFSRGKEELQSPYHIWDSVALGLSLVPFIYAGARYPSLQQTRVSAQRFTASSTMNLTKLPDHLPAPISESPRRTMRYHGVFKPLSSPDKPANAKQIKVVS